jgi:hypothetical protein
MLNPPAALFVAFFFALASSSSCLELTATTH